jgi:putative flavoprotein involved in K+ transport
MKSAHMVERVEVAIIGGGQAGLSVGYQLKQLGVPFVILDAQQRVGDAWRARWDSLRLFTARRFSSLAGMPMPGDQLGFPTKDEMADYLESYAKRFELPIEHGVNVERVRRIGRAFLLSAGDREIEAAQVVVAMANFQTPITPAFATKLREDIVQLHSTAYRSPSQLREGAVLVVGAGNSGAEIAMELAREGRSVVLAGRDPGNVPVNMYSFLGKHVTQPILMRFVFHRLLTEATPMGRKAKAEGPHTTPLIRTKPKDLTKAGVRRLTAKIGGVRDGLPVTAEGETVDVANVIWSTGYKPGFSWVDLPVFDGRGEPVQKRGVVTGQPGFYFVGLHFLYAMSSAMIHGLARDAQYVARAIADRMNAASPSSPRGADVTPLARRVG